MNQTMSQSDGTVIIATLIIIVIAFLLVGLPAIITLWKLFTKAHKPGWAAIVPLYNYFVFGRIAKGHIALIISGVILLTLSYIPGTVGDITGLAWFIVSIILLIGFIKRYRASAWFWVWFILLPIVAVFLVDKVVFIEEELEVQTPSTQPIQAVDQNQQIVQQSVLSMAQNMQPQNSLNSYQQSPDDTMQALIPTKNKPALYSYYFGVFSLIPILGLPFAFLAVIFGKKGKRLSKENPTPGASAHATAGIIMGTISLSLWVLFILFIVGVAILGE